MWPFKRRHEVVRSNQQDQQVLGPEGSTWKIVGQRKEVNMGTNHDGSRTTLPAFVRLENEEGDIIEVHPSNRNFVIVPPEEET